MDIFPDLLLRSYRKIPIGEWKEAKKLKAYDLVTCYSVSHRNHFFKKIFLVNIYYTY